MAKGNNWGHRKEKKESKFVENLLVFNKRFDSLFLPFLLYGLEVWGIYDKDYLMK